MVQLKKAKRKLKKTDGVSSQQIPNFNQSLQETIHSVDELQFGLPGVIRILSRRGKNQKNEYFFEGFKVLFSSELDEPVFCEEVFLDYENLKIIIKLPDPKDSRNKEVIRHEYIRHYALGADDMKTRSAIVAFASLDKTAKKILIQNEKKQRAKNSKEKIKKQVLK
jgi:hypothetical protein